MRDFNPIKRAHICKYCPDEHVGLITEEDRLATKQPDGWKCGKCVTTDLRMRMLRVLGPNNSRVKEFLQEEQRGVDRHNKYAERLNNAAGYKIMEKKENRYLSPSSINKRKGGSNK